MLDSHHTVLCKVLLGQVVDELTIDEDVDAVLDDLLALFKHALLLCLFDFYHLVHASGLDLTTKDFDLMWSV